MPAVTADGTPEPATVPAAGRVAAELARPGAGRVSVAGAALPPAVLEALPAGVETVAADAGGEAAHTALLVLDGAVDGPELERRLGTACRRFPGRLLVWQRDPVGDGPGAGDGSGAGTGEAGATGARPVPVERFFAFGFRRAFALVEDGVRHALHEYRLADYKQPPDWLNARYWANPERFGVDPDAEPGLGAGADPATDPAADPTAGRAPHP